jgi:hypothetical protein
LIIAFVTVHSKKRGRVQPVDTRTMPRELHLVDLAAERRAYTGLLAQTVDKLEQGGRNMSPHEYVQLSHEANYYNTLVHSLDSILRDDMWWYWRVLLVHDVAGDGQETKKTR